MERRIQCDATDASARGLLASSVAPGGGVKREIPRGSLDYQYITAHTAHKDLEKAMSVVLQESFRKPIDAAATNYEGRSRAPSQGV